MFPPNDNHLRTKSIGRSNQETEIRTLGNIEEDQETFDFLGHREREYRIRKKDRAGGRWVVSAWLYHLFRLQPEAASGHFTRRIEGDDFTGKPVTICFGAANHS